MSKKTDLLALVPIFAGLDKEILCQLAERANYREFAENAFLMHEGDPGECLYIIESGGTKVYVGGDADAKELVLYFMEPGDYVGDIALLDEHARSATVLAIEPTTTLALPKEDFMWLLHINDEVRRSIILSLTRRLRQDNMRQLSLAQDPEYRRLRSKLYELSVENSDGTFSTKRKFRHRDLASMIGSSRKMVSKLLGDLVYGEYLEISEDKLTIVKKLPKDW